MAGCHHCEGLCCKLVVAEVVAADEETKNIVAAACRCAWIVGDCCGAGCARSLLLLGKLDAAFFDVGEGEVVEVILDLRELCVDPPWDTIDDPLREDDWSDKVS